MLARLTSQTQCPVIAGITQTDTGSGSYHLDVIVDNPMGLDMTYTWFYYPGSGTGGMGGYAYFPEPGIYDVWVTVYFDDPQTQQPDDCQVSYFYQADVICDAVELDYPITVEDTLNQQFVVTSNISGGTPPYTYSWDVDLPYLDMGDGAITVPFTDAGYMNGNLVVVDANGCFAWPHFFGGTNPNAVCDFQVEIVQSDNVVTLNLNYSLGSSDLLYPMYEINFGDGSTSSVFNEDFVTHSYAEPGEYEVCIYATNEGNYCEENYCESIQVGMSTSIGVESVRSNFIIYPNPSDGEVIIRGELGSLVFIYDISGKIILQSRLDTGTLQMDQLANGSYMVKLQNGDYCDVKQLIVR